MKNEKGRIKLFIVILIIILIVGIIIFVNIYKMNTPTNTGNEPKIRYYDEHNGKMTDISNNQIFKEDLIVEYSKGNAKISKDGEKYTQYNGEILKDGKYIIIVRAEDGTIAKKEFIIDRLPPVVSGIKQELYKTEKTIQFEDPEDIKIATLSKKDGETINLKDIITKKNKNYTISDDGVYILYLEDYYENSSTIKFVIDKEK